MSLVPVTKTLAALSIQMVSSFSLPQHSPPLADSSASTARPPDLLVPLVVVFRLAAVRSSPTPLLAPRGFVRAVAPAGSSVQQRPRNLAASPSAHSRRRDGVDAEVLPGDSLRFPEWRAGSASRPARSALLPALASLPTPQP